MERRIIIALVEGDNAPNLAVRFTNLVLGTYDAIVIKVRLEDGTRFERVVTPDATDSELGSVTWSDGDLVRGNHTAEFAFTIGTDVFTVPRMYKIRLSVRANQD